MTLFFFVIESIVVCLIHFLDIENLVQSCPNLIELDLSDAQSITSKSIELISNNLNKIEYLAFNRCYSIIPSSYL